MLGINDTLAEVILEHRNTSSFRDPSHPLICKGDGKRIRERIIRFIHERVCAAANLCRVKRHQKTTFGKLGSICLHCRSGAQAEQVDEHPAAFIFELEDYPEGKVLTLQELRRIRAAGLTFQEIADHIGASEAYVRQTIEQKKYKRR